MSPVEILIADDHELVREGLVSIIAENHPEWKIVGEAATAEEAIRIAELLRPAVTILDLSLPDMSGLKVAERLAESVPDTRVIVLSMHFGSPIVHQLRKTGVSAYIVKNEAPKVLVGAIERVLAGEPFFASPMASRPLDRIERPDYVPAQFLLTRRELEVMRLLSLGKSHKEVASQLNMSVRTAETHHANVLAKLRVDSVGEMVRIAVRDGLI
jgi:DNA-binding NarL/FixJ family response regulator